MAYTVTSLNRYPVKSMMGEDIESTLVTDRGLAGDRAYALLEPESGRIGTAKIMRKWGPLFQCHARYEQEPGTGDAVATILLPDGSTASTNQPDIDAVLSDLLGREVELISQHREGLKLESGPLGEVSDENAETVDFPVINGFFDLASVHLLTTSSLAYLSALYPEGQFEARRFRPNIVIDSGDERGFVENDWVKKVVRIGSDVRLEVFMATIRCAATTNAQDDLPSDPGILKAAADHNSGNVGVYASVMRGGTVRIGDEVVVEA